MNIQTLTPRFEKEKTTNISASFKTGSWGLVNPSILLEQQLNSKWTVSANGEWMSSDGHYPYTLHYGDAKEDLTSREKRKNTDVQTFRAEAGLYGIFLIKNSTDLKHIIFSLPEDYPKPPLFTMTILYNNCGIKYICTKPIQKRIQPPMGIPIFCQMELELSALSGPRHSKF